MINMITWCLMLIFLTALPFSEVAVVNRFMKKEVDEINTLNNPEVEDEHLESHEAMQQEPTGSWARSPVGIPVQKQQNTFLNGKLVMHEPEPHIQEDMVFTDATPTEAMGRDARNVQLKEPDPNRSEALLELLVTIAGQPERWNNLMEYINVVFNSPMIQNLKNKHLIKPFISNGKMRIDLPQSKLVNMNHTYNDNIQHMIFYLQNNKGKSGANQNANTDLIDVDKQYDPIPEMPMNNKAWPIFPNDESTQLPFEEPIKRQDPEGTEDFEPKQTDNAKDKPNDDDSLRDYDSKYDPNNNNDDLKATRDQQKFLDELHRLDTLNRGNAKNDDDNLKEYESKFDLHEANPQPNGTKANTDSILRLYLKRDHHEYSDLRGNNEYGDDKIDSSAHRKVMFPQENMEAWPNFDEEFKYTDISNHERFDHVLTTARPKVTTIRPKDWFSFRRVTNGPTSGLEKTRARNAYIAVSVIAPTMRKFYRSPEKKMETDSIENELIQLKPWNHRDNLNHMKNLRAKWPIINREMKLN